MKIILSSTGEEKDVNESYAARMIEQGKATACKIADPKKPKGSGKKKAVAEDVSEG